MDIIVKCKLNANCCIILTYFSLHRVYVVYIAILYSFQLGFHVFFLIKFSNSNKNRIKSDLKKKLYSKNNILVITIQRAS